MTSRKRKAAVMATVSLLAERYPAAFFVFEGRRRPLKIGIAADICEAMPEINKEHLQWALARYCMSPGYLRSLTSGAVRVGLGGDAAGTVTDEAAAKAVAMLAQVVTARRKRTAKVEREPAKVGLAGNQAAGRCRVRGQVQRFAHVDRGDPGSRAAPPGRLAGELAFHGSPRAAAAQDGRFVQLMVHRGKPSRRELSEDAA